MPKGSYVLLGFVVAAVILVLIALQNASPRRVAPTSTSPQGLTNTETPGPPVGEPASNATTATHEASPKASATIEQSDELPLAGMWEIESYTWSFLPGVAASEVYEADDTPMARISADGDSITARILEPWNEQAPYAEFHGTRRGFEVELRTGDRNLPLVAKGQIGADLRSLAAEGGYSLDDASEAYLKKRAEDPEAFKEIEAGHLTIRMRRVSDVDGAPALQAADRVEERRTEAHMLADALRAYASEHGGKLPVSLTELIPDYLSDEALILNTDDRTIRYEPQPMPEALLGAQESWDDFNPYEVTGKRLADWEAHLQERWGSDSPLLPMSIAVTYDDPVLEFYVDALGRVVERDYDSNVEGIEDAREIRSQSQQNLKELGLALVLFRNEHEDYLPVGWLSLYAGYANDPSLLTHPADPPGTLSYMLLLPGASIAEVVDQLAARSAADETVEASAYWSQLPIAAENRPYGGEVQGRNVLFADGHVEFLFGNRFAELCEQLGIEMPS